MFSLQQMISNKTPEKLFIPISFFMLCSIGLISLINPTLFGLSTNKRSVNSSEQRDNTVEMQNSLKWKEQIFQIDNVTNILNLKIMLPTTWTVKKTNSPSHINNLKTKECSFYEITDNKQLVTITIQLFCSGWSGGTFQISNNAHIVGKKQVPAAMGGSLDSYILREKLKDEQYIYWSSTPIKPLEKINFAKNKTNSAYFIMYSYEEQIKTTLPFLPVMLRLDYKGNNKSIENYLSVTDEIVKALMLKQ